MCFMERGIIDGYFLRLLELDAVGEFIGTLAPEHSRRKKHHLLHNIAVV